MISDRVKQLILNNLLWFVASLGLAIVVWYVATITSNPIEEELFTNIPVQILLDENLVITNGSERTARVTIRAPRSILAVLAREDIIVQADLTDMGTGTHTVRLQADVETSNVIAATEPQQLTFAIEQIEAQQKPIQVFVTDDPPPNFSFSDPVLDIFQAEVRGPATLVSNVIVVRAGVDLTNRRNSIQQTVNLVPLNENGARVNGVTVTPQNAEVSVEIFRRNDVMLVSISPTLLLDTLETDYRITSLSVEPQTIFISGDQELLRTIDDVFVTEDIDLAERTDDFRVDVPVILPEGVSVFESRSNVTVEVGIAEETTIKQIDDVPVEYIGVDDTMNTVEINPDTISIVLSGPVSALEEIDSEDIQVVVDLERLDVGNHEIPPDISILGSQITPDSITSIIPSSVNVTISAIEPEPEATNSPDPTQES